MSTDASQSQGGADAPASVNNPRSAAAAATAAANAISRTKQARARTRFFDLWAVVAAILLLAAIVYLLNILSVPVAILIWTVIIVFCLRGIVNGWRAPYQPRVWAPRSPMLSWRSCSPLSASFCSRQCSA